MASKLAIVAMAVLVGGGVALASHAAAPASPAVSVNPPGGTLDAPFIVRVRGAPPGERVTVRVTRRTEDGTPWTATGVYAADSAGRVDAAAAPSLAGSYKGVGAHGLICSALPVEPERLGAYIAGFASHPRQPIFFDDPLGRTAIEVTASVGGRVVASTTAWRSYAEGTSGEEVAGPEGWKGVFFPPAAGIRAGAPVLLLPGSGGGVFRYRAALLASHGHPALALAMFRYPGLPDSLVDYPIERVRDAAVWLARRTGTKRAAVLGTSRGSEAAALAGVHFPDAFSGVILVVPSHLSDAGALGPAARKGESAWTVDGRPTPVTDLGFTPDDPRVVEQAKTLPGYNASAIVIDKWGSPEFEARYGIEYERIRAPVLVLAAGEDAVWPSWISAEHIRRRFAEHGKARQVEVHVYKAAGHGMVSLANGTMLSTFTFHPLLKGFMALGGQPEANCEASFDSFRATLAFLDRLKPRRHSSDAKPIGR
jgi:pimeloyl-ACP methyl ester carboxylesterase